MFLLKFILAIISIYFTVTGMQVEGVSLAFLAGMYTSGMQTYRSLLDKRMQNVAWNLSFWNQFLGFVGGRKSMFDPVATFAQPDKFSLRATGKPIEVLQDFRHMGGIDMDIPIFYPLTGKGVSGSVVLEGKGERPKLGIMQVAINQQRHAYVAQDNKMSKQILQSPEMVKKLMRSGALYLGDWFQRWLAYQPYLAFLEGFSHNLTKTAITGGLGKTKRSHWNVYTAGGSGRVTTSLTAATYEASVAAAINALTNTSSCHFSTLVIENMVYVASHNHRIKPLNMAGMNLYPIVISDAQAKQLQNDTKWNDRMKYAAERSLNENPLFTGKLAGIYGGALIIIDETVPSAYTNTHSTNAAGTTMYYQAKSTVTGDTTGICHGPADTSGDYDFMNTPVDSGPIKPAILFGASALACGVASDISFAEETGDFGQKIEIGADMIIGMQCADILDKDGYFGANSGSYRYENVSSLVCYTYSPSDASWS